MAEDKQTAYDKLKDKHKRFVDFYLQCWEATEAARRAGYKVEKSQTHISRLMQMPNIRAAIDEKREEFAKLIRQEPVERLIDEIRQIAYDDTSKAKMQHKLKAAELLMKYVYGGAVQQKHVDNSAIKNFTSALKDQKEIWSEDDGGEK